MLSTQLVWLLVLVPALIAGSRLGGIYGASLAELAVAAGCILPWYLIQLRKAGIPLGALAGHLWLPLAGAVLVALVALAAAQVAPSDVTALAASGLAMAAVVGLLVFRMRTVLSMIRQPAAVPAAADQAVAALAAGGELSAPDVAEALAAGHAGVDVPAAWIPDHLPVRQEAPDPLLSRTAYQDHTGPLPPYRDITGYPPPRQDLFGYPPPRYDLTATSPLYWKTVAALRWDPADHCGIGADDTSLTGAPGHRGMPPDTIAMAIAADGSLAGRSRSTGRRSMPATADALADIAHEERS